MQAPQSELGELAPRLCGVGVGVGVAAPFLLGGWHSLMGLPDADANLWNEIDLSAEVQAMTALPVSFAKDTSAACVASGASREPLPAQLIDQASLWELEQRFKAQGLAHCVVCGTAFIDLDAVVIDGSVSRDLLDQLILAVKADLSCYNPEGLWPVTVLEGSIGSDARALGGALLPLHANFASDRDLFLKAAN